LFLSYVLLMGLIYFTAPAVIPLMK